MNMSDEFESLNSKVPDFESAIKARISGDLPPEGTVDPYKLMIKRKRQSDNIDPGPIIRWPEEDEKALKDYCIKMGIYGFSSKIHPKLALAQLKRQFGDYSETSLEERIPNGYEKLGTKSNYNRNYPYSEAMRKKQLLWG